MLPICWSISAVSSYPTLYPHTFFSLHKNLIVALVLSWLWLWVACFVGDDRHAELLSVTLAAAWTGGDWRKLGGALALILFLVWLVPCAIHGPVWSLEKILSLPAFLVWCRLLQLQRTVVSTDAELPDELLYGRAGYLYALLYLNTEIGPDTVPQSVIKEVRYLLFSLQCHSISEIELESLLHIIQGIERGMLERRVFLNWELLHPFSLFPLSLLPRWGWGRPVHMGPWPAMEMTPISN